MDSESEGQIEDLELLDSAGADAPALYPPGSACNCDDECQGTVENPGVCVYGICMQEATGECSSAAQGQECPGGLRCGGLKDYLAYVCWPECGLFECDGECDSEGVCVPPPGDNCEPSCGSYCSGGLGSAIGGPCETSRDCADPEAACYKHPDFIKGYCLIFGCSEEGSSCGTGGVCVAGLTYDSTKVCMGSCTDSCRLGYECKSGFCVPGCADDSDCPEGARCISSACLEALCSPSNPSGSCPEGEWCRDGACTSEAFVCARDEFESNDSRENASPLQHESEMDGLSICSNDEDWYAIAVPSGTIVVVTMQFNSTLGDLDLVAYDSEGTLLGSRNRENYPYSNRSRETGLEAFGFYDANDPQATNHVLALGYEGAQGTYTLTVDYRGYQDYADGVTSPVCTDLYSDIECKSCTEDSCSQLDLLIFPFPDPDDGYVGAGYVFDAVSNYRWVRRELLMLIRYGIHEVEVKFPGTNPLGIGDISQRDGFTPGYDVLAPYHPYATHDDGGNIDVAYYQTGPDNRMRSVCGPDNSNISGGYCTQEAETEHMVDLERQAYFQVMIARSPRLRTVIFDSVIGPLVQQAIDNLRDEGAYRAEEAQRAKDKMVVEGWPNHYDHNHISMMRLPVLRYLP